MSRSLEGSSAADFATALERRATMAALSESAAVEFLTTTVGTPQYMGPEMIANQVELAAKVTEHMKLSLEERTAQRKELNEVRESLEKSEFNGRKADVYAFGIVMFEMLVHRPPWEGVSLLSMQHRVHNGDRPSFEDSDVAPGAPSVWVTLMEKAWSQDPDHRPDFGLLQQEFSALPPQTATNFSMGVTKNPIAATRGETGNEPVWPPPVEELVISL